MKKSFITSRPDLESALFKADLDNVQGLFKKAFHIHISSLCILLFYRDIALLTLCILETP